MEKIGFFINPKIRNFEKIKSEIASEFSNLQYQIFTSEYAGHFLSLSSVAIQQNFKTIIAVGGDGTLNEVVNGVLMSFENQGNFDWGKISEIKVGVLPAGSGNDFVKNLPVDFSLKNLKKIIISGNCKATDVGLVKFKNKEGKEAIRFFINILDAGMGAETVIKKSTLPLWLGANFIYFYSIISTLLTYKKNVVKFYNSEMQWEGKILNLVIANGKYFGNGLGISPDSVVDDGIFNVTVIGDVSLLDYAKEVGNVKKCQKLQHQQVHYYSAQALKIEGISHKQISIDMDGEFVGYAPLEIECLQKKINILQ